MLKLSSRHQSLLTIHLSSLGFPILPFCSFLLLCLLLAYPPAVPACSHCLLPLSTPRCCLAPASAAKFPEVVLAAGLTPETPADILALERKETRCTPMRREDDWTLMLRATIEDLSQQWRGRTPSASE